MHLTAPAPQARVYACLWGGYGSKQLDVFKKSGGIEYASDIAAILTHDTEKTRAADGE
jgi:hypothetical protein